MVITNSEVGHGTLAVEPSILRLVCTNGLILPDSSLKRRHVGRGSEIAGVEEYFTDETHRVTDAAFWRQVVDVVRGAFDDTKFKLQVGKMQAALDNRIPEGGATLQEITEVVQKKYALSDSIGDMILKNLISGGDLSQYGLCQAVTATAKSDKVDYATATDLERTGGNIIEMKREDWRELVAA